MRQVKPYALLPLQFLITIWVWAFAISALTFLVFGGAMLRIVLLPFDRERLVPIRKLYSILARLAIFINPLWSLKIENRNKFSNDRLYVLVSNHQSVMDILLLQCLFKHFRWVSKAENFRLPLLGWMMFLVKDIRLERSNPASFAALMKKCSHALATGNSLAIFPEGSRSTDGEIKRFKDGAFWIALHNKVSILPLVLDNTLNALPRKGFIIKTRHHMRLRVLNEIPYETFRNMESKEIAAMTRDLIAGELQQMRNPSQRV